MQKTIIIPIEKYNVLRETFEKAIDMIFVISSGYVFG